MNEKKTTILEKSTNTHITNSDIIVTDEFNTMTTMVLETNEQMIVEHGHHFTVATEPETQQVIKITQQEYNPILKLMQNSFD